MTNHSESDTGTFLPDADVMISAGNRPSACLRHVRFVDVVEVRLRAKLLEAADEIENWGGYAMDYFQEKHHLKDVVAEYRAAAREP